jgi:fructosamine-3-kinase
VNVRPGALACFRKNRTVARAGSSPARAAEAWALRLLGDVTTHRAHPDVATATAHDGAAMNLASELEMRPLLAHCHFGLGRLYRRTGKPEQAKEHLTTGAAMYGEMGTTYWLEKLEKDV